MNNKAANLVIRAGMELGALSKEISPEQEQLARNAIQLFANGTSYGILEWLYSLGYVQKYGTANGEAQFLIYKDQGDTEGTVYTVQQLSDMYWEINGVINRFSSTKGD